METPPTLDYETPKPKKRSGFLAMYNPDATLLSILRNAITQSVYSAILWIIGWKLHYWENWWYFFALAAVFAIWGALQEWLIPRDHIAQSVSDERKGN